MSKNCGTSVTIIIPTRNRQKQTENAIRSVLNQDLDALSVIVVDDASDRPFSLPPDMDHQDRVHVLRHDTNRGAGAARNTGLAHAAGEYLGFLDSDDIMKPASLRQRIDHIQSHEKKHGSSSTLFFVCGWDEIDEKGKLLRSRIPRDAKDRSDFFSGCWFCPGSAFLAHRTFFDNNGVHYDEALRRLEDYDLFARLATEKLDMVVQPWQGIQITRGSDRSGNHIREAAKLISSKLGNLYEKGRISGKEWQIARSYLDYEHAHLLRHEGRRFMAFITLVRSWLRHPRLSIYPGPGWTRIEADR